MEILCGGEFYGNLTADLFQLRRFHFNNLVISMPEKTWPSVVKIQNMLRITTRNHEIRITHSTAKLNKTQTPSKNNLKKIFYQRRIQQNHKYWISTELSDTGEWFWEVYTDPHPTPHYAHILNLLNIYNRQTTKLPSQWMPNFSQSSLLETKMLLLANVFRKSL